MKATLVLLLALAPAIALADHSKLKSETDSLVRGSEMLEREARRVVGYYPTYNQRYAYEHIQFLRRSAARFKFALQDLESRDHSAIRRAYFRLERDSFYARDTFEDLFENFQTWDHDHPDFDRLNRILIQIEDRVREVGHHVDEL